MKKIIYLILLSTMLLYLLVFPEDAIAAASRGLVLWYTKMLPTLLPFSILSYIFISTGLLQGVVKILHKILSPVLPISINGVYPLFCGFLFGFPLGSKISAKLVEEGQISYEEGNGLFAICNNISPVFVSGFILTTTFQKPWLKGVTFLILYVPPIFYYMADTWLTRKKHPLKQEIPLIKKTASRSQISFKIIDAGIMMGFETLTRLGGYIMLFAIFAEMMSCIPIHNTVFRCLLIGSTELTNGILYLSSSPFSFPVQYILTIFCTAFGGLSGIAQTASMVKDAGFSIKKYMLTKFICSLFSAFLAYIFCRYAYHL